MNAAEQSVCSLSLPDDILLQILSELPVKSLRRFRLVSKHWSSTISDPHFIKCHINQARTRSHHVHDAIVVLLPGNFQSTEGSTIDNVERCKDQDDPDSPNVFVVTGMVSQSLNGLILVKKADNHYRVVNPTTREFFPLRHIVTPNQKSKLRVDRFGYDPINGKHKVLTEFVRVGQFNDEDDDDPYYYDDNEFELAKFICVIGGDNNSWRRLSDELLYRPSVKKSVCINGVIYYKANLRLPPHTMQPVIIAFDVRSEKFRSISIPIESKRGYLIQFDGLLAIVDHNPISKQQKGINLWTLVDSDHVEPEWGHKHFEFPSSWANIIDVYQHLRIVGQPHNDEIIVAPVITGKPLCLFYLNLKLGSVETVKIDCLKDYMPLCQGKNVGISVTPHVESLVSCGCDDYIFSD